MIKVITHDNERISKWASKHLEGITWNSPQCFGFELNDKLIGAVIFSETPWTIENEILTPTMKIRREQIEKQFGEDAERLAREGAEAGSILMHWAG